MCRSVYGKDQPSIVLEDKSVFKNAEFSGGIGGCIIQPAGRTLTCEGRHENTQRFCPCRRKAWWKGRQSVVLRKDTRLDNPETMGGGLTVAISTFNRSSICNVIQSIQQNSFILNTSLCVNKTQVLVMLHKEVGLTYRKICPRLLEHPCILSFKSAYAEKHMRANRFNVIDKAHQRQSLHIVELLRHANRLMPTGHVMLLDDDSIWCPTLYKTLVQSLGQQMFVFMHLGQGSSGIVIPQQKVWDATTYIVNHIDESNVDILLMKWAEKTKECRLASRKRLMLHKGLTSTFGYKWKDDNVCGDALQKRRLFLTFPQVVNGDLFGASCNVKSGYFHRQ